MQLSDILQTGVISKEAVGNIWDILNAILGHSYHSDQSNSFMRNE